MDTVFGILGRTALRIGGSLDESWGARRERALLATLLTRPGRPVPIDTLIEWVWPEEDEPPRNPIPTFHTYATRIRRSLGRVDVPIALVAEDGTYRLDVETSTIDLYRFRQLMAEARAAFRQGLTRHAITFAAQAIKLWRGRPVEDLSSEPARAWRTHVVQDEWIPANTILIEALLAEDEFGEALTRLNELQAEHLHDLSLAKLRMSALRGLSRSSEADAYYFSVRRRLLADGDEQAADHLRRHHENLRTKAIEPDPIDRVKPATQPRQLPHDVPDFIGRADLLRALDTATKKPSSEPSGGVVILDGMAGVGKTTLAVHWGHLSRHRFPDGDFFVNLNGFSDSPPIAPSKVVDDLLIALGHPPDSNLDQRSRELLLSRLLANRRTLVILDNARNTAQVKDLIRLLPSCSILITSRQRLTTLSATTGASRVRVEPMDTSEANELLRARVGAHRTIDEQDSNRLVRLCGGLPLMLTVLADYLATSGPADVAAFAQQLDRRQLITHIGEDGDGAAVAYTFLSWSYQRLEYSERRLFRLLSLHAGPDIGIDVACACDGRALAETKRSLGILVGCHLLERPMVLDRHRFHDILREFAAYCAERDETPDSRAAAERRMLSFYLRSAAAASRVLYPYRTIVGEPPDSNGVEPLAFAKASEAKFWFNQERTNLAAAVSVATSRGHHDYAWRLADTVAIFFDRHGYYDESRLVRQLGVSSARAVQHRDGETGALEGLAMVQMILGDLTEAKDCLNRALGYATADHNERAQVTTLHLLGRLEMLRGDPAAAVDMYQQSLEVARRIDDEYGQCWAHCRIGEALPLLGRQGQALVHLHEAHWYAQRIDDQSALASSLATMGSVHLDAGEYGSARIHAEQALILAETIPDLAITAQASTTLAEISSRQGDVAAAAEYARHAVDVSQRTHNVTAEARAHEILGEIHLAGGDPSEATQAWREAARLYDRIGSAARSAVVATKLRQVSIGDIELPIARGPSSPDRVIPKVETD